MNSEHWVSSYISVFKALISSVVLHLAQLLIHFIFIFFEPEVISHPQLFNVNLQYPDFSVLRGGKICAAICSKSMLLSYAGDGMILGKW